MSDNSYPRIELYSEVDLGDPNAGTQKWELPDGKIGYGGAADHQPHIKLKTISLNDEQKKQLLSQKLMLLPYFREQKPELTLDQYFQASQGAKSEFKKLFPLSLDGLYSHTENDFFSTKLVYEKSYNRNLTVVWLNPTTWYIDEVYYRAVDLDKLIAEGQASEEIIMEGAMKDYLRFSPIFQRKLSEGFSELKPKTERTVIAEKDLIYSYQLTAGMPNTTSYHYEVWSDGALKNGGQSKSISYNKITELMLKSLHLDWKQYDLETNSIPQRQDHDRQSIILTIWHEGRDYRLINPAFTSGLPLENFRDFAAKLIIEELRQQK